MNSIPMLSKSTLNIRTTSVLILFTLVAFVLEPSGSSANENVRCVQKQLIDEGLNPGPSDGLIGQKTLSAVQNAREIFPQINQYPTLTPQNASVYCRGLGLARNSTQGWSSQNGFIRLQFGETVSAGKVARVVTVSEEVERYFKDELRVTIPQYVDVIVTDNATEALELTEVALRKRGLRSKISQIYKGWCQRAATCGLSFGGVTVIKFDKSSPFSALTIKNFIAHEFAHEVHTQYVGNYRGQGADIRIKKRGPVWLSEAVALAIELNLKQPGLPIERWLNSYDIRRHYSANRLRSFQNWDSLDETDFYDYSSFAGLLLVSQSSRESILEFWEKTPFLGWQKAFESAFGQSVEEFYDGFRNLPK